MVSVSWSLKQCQVWVSCGVSLKSSQFLVGYSYKLWATIDIAYLAGSTPDLIKGLWLAWCLCFLLITWRIPSCTKDAGTQVWRFYVGTSSTSPCSMSCVGVSSATGSAVSLWRATYSLGNSLSYLGIAMGPLFQTNEFSF